ncbi:MAG: hypothetical protein FJ390_07810 [Verrucomicrobia bacterium]|nr:hypothetical protein [Verrucomicrobiota bacterium]
MNLEKYSLPITRYSLLLLFFATIPLAASWQLPFWSKAETQSQQQQQKWLHEQQQWNQQGDPRFIERKMRSEHQKWERELKKKKQTSLLNLKT